MTTDIHYCRDLVERYDRDRYILSLAAEPKERAALWALYAFNHEIAKTREMVRELAAGHIRLTWWRDALAAPVMPVHEVAQPLGQVIREYNLPRDLFEKLIDARALDLGNTPPASLDDLISYIDATNTPLLELSAHIVGRADVLRSLGVAYGLAGIIRALPFMAQQNRCLLPLPMVYDIGLMPEQFHHLKSSPALSRAIQALTNAAWLYLGAFDAPNAFFKKQKRMTAIYLRRIEKAGYNPFDARVYGPVPFLGLRLLF